MSREDGEDDAEPAGEDAGDSPDGLAGLSVDRAVEVVAGAHDLRDPESVRETLSVVADDGVVSREAAEAALSDVSKVVATPETRVELAGSALDEARAAAEPVADLDAVRARLEGLDERLAALEDRTGELGDELRRLAEQVDESGGLYEVAQGARQLAGAADDAARAADELAADVEAFEEWVEDPDARVGELAADLDALEGATSELAEAVERLAETAGDEPPEGAGAGVPGDDVDLAAAWLDASLRRRVYDLLAEDVRAELADLREWAGRTGADHEGLGDVERRLEAVGSDLSAVGDRLDDLAREGWTDRFGDRLAAFEDELGAFESPVDWGAVQATLAEHRPEEAEG